MGCHQSSESIDDALASNLKYIKSKNCQKKNLNAMHAITNHMKKVILEDIKKKKI